MDADLQELYGDEGGDFYDTPKVYIIFIAYNICESQKSIPFVLNNV